MVKLNKLIITAVSLLVLVLYSTCYAEYDYIISEEFDEVPEYFEINLNDFDMSGHEIYAEDSALYLKKAGDVGNPEIKVSFDAIKENVVVEMEVNMDDGNFSVLDSSGQKVIDFYNGTGNHYNKLEMRIDSSRKLRFGYTRGEWIKLKFAIDLETEMFYTYVNGSDTPVTTTWNLMGERDNVAAFVLFQKTAEKSSAIRSFKLYREPEMTTKKDVEYFISKLQPEMEMVSSDIELPVKAPLGSIISWTSENTDIITISEDGKKGIVTRGEEDKTATLAATFSLNGYQREHRVEVVVERALSDDEKVQSAYDKLDIGNLGFVTSDFELPEKGYEGVGLSWRSSNDEVISIDGFTAKVKPAPTDTAVTLTAAISSGEAAMEKDFSAYVLADLGENLAADAILTPSTEISSDKASGSCDKNYYSGWKAVPVEAAPTLLIDLKEKKAISHIRYRPLGAEGNIYRIYLSEDNENYILSDEKAYQDDVTALELSEIGEYRYVKFEIANPENRECGLYEAEVCYAPTAKQIVDADMKEFSFDKISSESADSINNDLKLMLSGRYGSDITYISSDSKIIKIDGDEGIVKRPSGKANKNVTLTVTFSKEGINDNIKLSLIVLATGKTSSVSSSGGSSGGGGGSSSGGFRTFGDTTSAVITVPQETKPDEDKSTEDKKKGYDDLELVSWAEEYINDLSEKGIVSGDGDGKFRPTDNVKREEFVLMLIKALNIELADSDAVFDDVEKEHWSSRYINTAAALGIVSGMEDNTFGIGKNITRQDMAVMMYRAIKDRALSSENENNSFADIEYVSDYAKDAALALFGAKVMNGDENGLFNPRNNATRAETAVAIARLIKLYE